MAAGSEESGLLWEFCTSCEQKYGEEDEDASLHSSNTLGTQLVRYLSHMHSLLTTHCVNYTINLFMYRAASATHLP